jgi:hypothetical protein
MSIMSYKKEFYRILLLLLALLTLASGTWAGLTRLGWHWPTIQPTLPLNHGPLMVPGFFGALIALERAVAIKKTWAYAASLACGIGGLLLAFGYLGFAGPLLLTLGSVMLVFVFIYVLQKHRAGYLILMALGAAALLVGNLLWLSGWQVYQFVLWWEGFLILTIASERMELGRMIRLSPSSQAIFSIAILVYITGLVVLLMNWSLGIRISSAGLILLALWLLRYDIARRTVKQSGLTRFIAVCLLSGYVWLIVSGIIGLVYGGVPAGPIYDAMLHSIFLGFVFSMIFGHAPIIFPAILKFDIQYKPIFYLPLILLHLSLFLRITGDLLGFMVLRLWGGLFNVLVVILYFLMISPLMGRYNNWVLKKTKDVFKTGRA